MRVPDDVTRVCAPHQQPSSDVCTRQGHPGCDKVTVKDKVINVPSLRGVRSAQASVCVCVCVCVDGWVDVCVCGCMWAVSVSGYVIRGAVKMCV